MFSKKAILFFVNREDSWINFRKHNQIRPKIAQPSARKGEKTDEKGRKTAARGYGERFRAYYKSGANARGVGRETRIPLARAAQRRKKARRFGSVKSFAVRFRAFRPRSPQVFRKRA